MKQKLYIWFSFIVENKFVHHRDLGLNDLAVIHEGRICEVLSYDASRFIDSNIFRPEFWNEITNDNMLDEICLNINFDDYNQLNKENYKYVKIVTVLDILKRKRKINTET